MANTPEIEKARAIILKLCAVELQKVNRRRDFKRKAEMKEAITSVAAGLTAARNDEREAAARVCENLVTFTENHEQKDDNGCTWCKALEDAATAIRARKG
jgi:hypothetical protein